MSLTVGSIVYLFPCCR